MYLPYPHSNDPNALGLMVVVAPAVFLLCWFYNAYRLGKLKKMRHTVQSIINSIIHKKGLFIICSIILGILVLWFLLSFFRESNKICP